MQNSLKAILTKERTPFTLCCIQEGVHVALAKVEAVSKWATPTNVIETRSFLELASDYRNFVEKFSKLVTPLTVFSKRGKKCEWAEKRTNYHPTHKE